MPYLTPNSINNKVALRLVMVSITPELVGAADDGICRLSIAENWEQNGALTPDEVAQYFLGVCAQMVSMSLTGLILPYATALPPSFALMCDGATYARVDYPALYAAIAPAFILDADNFKTPDLRDRALVGAGGAYSMGAVFGVNSHTLTLAEIPAHSHTSPAHSHTDLGHTHAESTALPTTVLTGELPVPIPAALPSVGVTGVGNASISSVAVTINNSGGGGSHENRQPSLAGGYCIVAY
jgi:microcystin-dependent protein